MSLTCKHGMPAGCTDCRISALESTISEQKRTILDMEAREKQLVEAMNYALWQHAGNGSPMHNHWTAKFYNVLNATPSSTSELTARFVVDWVRENWKSVAMVDKNGNVYHQGLPIGLLLYAIPDKE